MKTPAGFGSSGGAACGASFAQADEILVEAPDGALHRCVLFEGMVLTAIAGENAVGKYDGDGYVRVLPGENFSEARESEAHRVHVVDVQGEQEPFVLIVLVREEDARIVSADKFT